MGQQTAYVTIASNKGLQNQIINAPDVDVTFWKYVTRPHTLFGISNQRVEIYNIGFGQSCSVDVPKAADMLHKCHFEFTLPALAGSGCAWTHYPGFAMIETITIKLGSQEFDTHTGEWMYIWSELTMTHEKKQALEQLVGNRTELITPGSSIPAATIIVPLYFWFCRRPCLALPLASLDFANIRFDIKFRAFNQITVGTVTTTAPQLTGCMYVDYIHLDVAEHNSLVDNNMDVVYENLQIYNDSVVGSTKRTILQVSHPTKFVAWTNQKLSNVANGANRLFDYTDSGTTSQNYWSGKNPLTSAVFNMYAGTLDQLRSGMYYNTYIPYAYFTRKPAEGINVFSWALNPEDPQPSGTLNFSKIDQASLEQNFTDVSEAYVNKFYVWCYNTMTITNGSVAKEFASLADIPDQRFEVC